MADGDLKELGCPQTGGILQRLARCHGNKKKARRPGNQGPLIFENERYGIEREVSR